MSDDRGKGISLRKKREKRPKGGAPTISAPRQISAPMPTGLAATQSRPSQDSTRSGSARRPEAPRERPQRADKTADLVKRRYSQKVPTLPPDFGNGAPMPAMPQMPAQYRNGPPGRDERPQGPSEGRSLQVDKRVLEDPSLRPDQYVATILADASEDDIRRFQKDLRGFQTANSQNLQNNVYQNRQQFIKISKEAEKLKSEMRTLRQLMSELTSTLGQTTSVAGVNGDAISARKTSNRSSVANLDALWNSQLQELWKRVEGSQKYLPAVQGRHIVWESGRWVELNAATWKARRRVHLILLNDHLLVAAEKKQRADVAGQGPREKKSSTKEWVAQRCWALQGVEVTDLASRTKLAGQEGKGASNAVHIRVGNETFTFAVYQGDSTEKAAFMSTYRKTLEDLRKSTEAETEERGRAQDSVNYFAARDLNVLRNQELVESLAENAANNRASLFVDIDGKQQNIRWVESQLDDLDIDIALQNFEEAVKKVERLKTLAKNIRSNVMAQNLVTFKVNERATRLATVLIRQLVENNNWISSVKKHVTWIVRLGFEDKAREAFLEARGDVIKLRTRQCIFEGNLPDYIFQISFIYFTIIKNTVDIYQKCFAPQLMSACVKWAKEHVDAFNVILARQLSSVNIESNVWNECMQLAHEHAAMLADVGLDFKELVGNKTDEEESQPIGLGVNA